MPRVPQWLFYAITLGVLGTWIGGIIVSIFTSWQLPESLNGAVPIVLVGVFGFKAVADSQRGGDDE